VIIDTECHVLFRTFPRESNPDRPITTRASWHEYSGDLFAAEMERSGVDKGFLISYDADDIRWYLEETVGGDATDFYGGRKYTLESAVKKYPDRFLWFATREGFVVGILTAGYAAGQLVFLPTMATLATNAGWRIASRGLILLSSTPRPPMSSVPPRASRAP